jgi:hypothetical protein
MNGFFNFLKNLFSGILSFIGGLVGSKKATDDSAIAEAKATPTTRKSSAYFLELDDAKGVSSVQPPSPEKAPDAGDTAAPAAKPAAAAKAPSSPQPTIVNFATEYLIKPSSSSSRRRAGANMTYFLDMARASKVAR